MATQTHKLISVPGIVTPGAVNPDELGLTQIREILDISGALHSVYALTPEDEMPVPIAEWLRYRTFSENVVAAEHEGDKTRFKDVDEIVDSFLTNQLGRTVFLAFDHNHHLSGTTWLHRLKNDMDDHLLVDSANRFLFENDFFDVPSDKISTYAIREYGVAVRRGLDVQLGSFGIEMYFQDIEPDCVLVIGRHGAHDNYQIEHRETRSQDIAHKFTTLESAMGWMILGALNPSLITDKD